MPADVKVTLDPAGPFNGKAAGAFPLIASRFDGELRGHPGFCHTAGVGELRAPEALRERFRHTTPARQRPVAKEIVCDRAGERGMVSAGQRGFPIPLGFPVGVADADFAIEVFVWQGLALAAPHGARQRQGAIEPLRLLVAGAETAAVVVVGHGPEAAEEYTEPAALPKPGAARVFDDDVDAALRRECEEAIDDAEESLALRDPFVVVAHMAGRGGVHGARHGAPEHPDEAASDPAADCPLDARVEHVKGGAVGEVDGVRNPKPAIGASGRETATAAEEFKH